MAFITYQVRPAYPSTVGGTIFVDNTRTYDVGAALVAGGGTLSIADTDSSLLAALDRFLPIYRTGGSPGPGASTTHYETVRVLAADTIVANEIPVRQSDGTWLSQAVPTSVTTKSTAINGAGTHTTSATPSTSTQVVAANTLRAEITITNNGSTGTVYLGIGATAVVGGGVRLEPGQAYYSGSYRGVINSISTTASVACSVAEV